MSHHPIKRRVLVGGATGKQGNAVATLLLGTVTMSLPMLVPWTHLRLWRFLPAE
jgi:hypothetical protein